MLRLLKCLGYKTFSLKTIVYQLNKSLDTVDAFGSDEGITVTVDL